MSERVTAGRSWVGYIISALPVLFLLMDAVGKFVKPEPVVTATTELGFGENIILPLGIILLASTILYVVPKTAILGAILLTGYLGGAVATHVRIGSEVFPIVLPIVIGILLWMGLYLRDIRLRSILPLRKINTRSGN